MISHDYLIIALFSLIYPAILAFIAGKHHTSMPWSIAIFALTFIFLSAIVWFFKVVL